GPGPRRDARRARRKGVREARSGRRRPAKLDTARLGEGSRRGGAGGGGGRGRGVGCWVCGGGSGSGAVLRPLTWGMGRGRLPLISRIILETGRRSRRPAGRRPGRLMSEPILKIVN